MTPQPLSRASAIIERINDLRGNSSVHSFDTVPLRRDANKVRNDDPALGDMLLGVLASLEGKVAEMNRRHINSIRLSPGDYEYLNNYGVSLGNLYFFDEAANYREKAFRAALHKPDLECLAGAIRFSLLAGNVLQGNQIAVEFAGLAGSSTELLDLINTTASLCEEVTSERVDSHLLKKKMSITQDVLTEKAIHIPLLGESIQEQKNENSTVWINSLLLNADYDQIVQLEDEIDIRLAQAGLLEFSENCPFVLSLSSNDEMLDLLPKLDNDLDTSQMVKLDDSFFSMIEDALK